MHQKKISDHRAQHTPTIPTGLINETFWDLMIGSIKKEWQLKQKQRKNSNQTTNC